jgi:AraC-like DNA-binding protein
LGSVAPLVGILDRILDEGQRSDAQTGRVVDGLEKVLLAQIERYQGTIKGNKTISRTVYDTAMDILLREYQTLYSLSDLAKRTGYSSEYLCRLFKKYHSQSPYQVLLQRKMSAAWFLLRDGQLQVSAVAQELGYEDPLHFSRVFHKVMGCAPSSVKSGNKAE